MTFAPSSSSRSSSGNDHSPLLAIRDLRIGFGALEAVRGISLELNPGEVLGLVGESGSGKSATALAVMGLHGPAVQVTGSIRLRGCELVGLSHTVLRSLRGNQMAMIFQEPMTALNPVMTIGSQVGEAIQAHEPHLRHGELRSRVLAALDAVALPNSRSRLGDYPHQFSGGQRQRILIAMALVHQPALLLADEPTTALDVTVQAQILALLGRLQRERGLAMLFTSHDLAVIRQVATRVAVMRHGLILETGPAAQVFTHPSHPYTQQLLRAVPTMSTDRSQPLATV